MLPFLRLTMLMKRRGIEGACVLTLHTGWHFILVTECLQNVSTITCRRTVWKTHLQGVHHTCTHHFLFAR